MSKEILGYIFDGIIQTMQLPTKKLDNMCTTIKQALCKQCITFKDLEKLNGELRHATLAMTQANRLFQPVIKALMKKRKFYCLIKDLPLILALQAFSTIVSLLAKEQNLSSNLFQAPQTHSALSTHLNIALEECSAALLISSLNLFSKWLSLKKCNNTQNIN